MIGAVEVTGKTRTFFRPRWPLARFIAPPYNYAANVVVDGNGMSATINQSSASHMLIAHLDRVTPV